MKKRYYQMTEEEKARLAEMLSKIILWIEEGRSISYMADNLNLHPLQVESNIDELLYILRRQVGKWRFFKMLFIK